jgi:hypothetical protein
MAPLRLCSVSRSCNRHPAFADRTEECRSSIGAVRSFVIGCGLVLFFAVPICVDASFTVPPGDDSVEREGA